MPILNYTTSINPDRSIAEIQQSLVAHGASRVMVEYAQDRMPASLSFVIETQFGARPFRLPSNIDGVLRVLNDQWQQGRVAKRLACREHAARVAWRIVKDWVQVQLALVESGISTVEEVLLPYLLGADDRTLYEIMVDQRLALPAPA
jgi:hypothetical protein